MEPTSMPTTVERTAAAPSPAAAAARLTSRQFFIDHLRATLVILVVLHHVALVYGAAAPFYYVEPPLTDPLAYLALLVFALTNQAWFMSALFLIAGYFTPGSFERKGPRAFIRGDFIVSEFRSSCSSLCSTRSHRSATGRCQPS